MESVFKDDLELIPPNTKNTIKLKGVIRRDGSAAILPPEPIVEFDNNWKIRHHYSVNKYREYSINAFFHDTNRPLTRKLIKPVVVKLLQTSGD